MTIKSPTGRPARWPLRFQTYNLNINCTPGRTNMVADGLSRSPCNNHSSESCFICRIEIDIPSLGAETIRTKQLKDSDLKEIITNFELA